MSAPETPFYPMTHDDAVALDTHIQTLLGTLGKDTTLGGVAKDSTMQLILAAIQAIAPGLVTTEQYGYLAPASFIEDGMIKDATSTNKGLMTAAYAAVCESLKDHGVFSRINRWLRFDPENKKGLIIKAGTHLIQENGEVKHYFVDTAIDLTDVLDSNGADYGVYLLNDGSVTAELLSGDAPADSVKIGRFHTLCNAAGTITMIAPEQPSSGIAVGGNFLVKAYRQDTDPDFYAFYLKEVTAKTVQTQYDVITCEHPLSGFSTGDILPESVFCLSFCPDTLYEDAMIYDKDTDRCVDIYLQSGTGHNTRSEYNATHTVSRSPWNHQEDMRTVGKRLLRDCEFTSAALGSNERTSIAGSADKTYVGGHSDTNSRRMISAVGCEEMCGYLQQWLDEIAAAGGSGWASNTDGHDSFGQNYGQPYVLYAGGYWGDSSNAGSRCRSAKHSRAAVYGNSGGRGSSRVRRIMPNV